MAVDVEREKEKTPPNTRRTTLQFLGGIVIGLGLAGGCGASIALATKADQRERKEAQDWFAAQEAAGILVREPRPRLGATSKPLTEQFAGITPEPLTLGEVFMLRQPITQEEIAANKSLPLKAESYKPGKVVILDRSGYADPTGKGLFDAKGVYMGYYLVLPVEDLTPVRPRNQYIQGGRTINPNSGDFDSFPAKTLYAQEVYSGLKGPDRFYPVIFLASWLGPRVTFGPDGITGEKATARLNRLNSGFQVFVQQVYYPSIPKTNIESAYFTQPSSRHIYEVPPRK